MNSLIDLTGQRYGKLVVREKLPPEEDGKTRWLCDCDCGRTCVANSYALRSGRQKSCGCGRKKDITGVRFGHLTAIERSERYIVQPGRGKKYLWKCRCDCGEIVYRLPEKLRPDVKSSCRQCAARSAVDAMVDHAGFVEGTQLSKLNGTKLSAANNSGVRGVFFNKRTGKWRAVLCLQGQDHYLGEFYQKADAVKARQRAEEEYFAPILERHGL